jgi:hypothetical protein
MKLLLYVTTPALFHLHHQMGLRPKDEQAFCSSTSSDKEGERDCQKAEYNTS